MYIELIIHLIFMPFFLYFNVHNVHKSNINMYIKHLVAKGECEEEIGWEWEGKWEKDGVDVLNWTV